MVERFNVKIVETVFQVFPVLAKTEEEALKIAAEKYHRGEIVVDQPELETARAESINGQMKQEIC